MTASKEQKIRARMLRASIDTYRNLYHENDESPISPEALDSLKKELKELEDSYAELKAPNSPSTRVAGAVKKELSKISHAFRQWSLEDAFSEKDVRAFLERTEKVLTKKYGKKVTPTYVCELKIDGLHIVLTYKKGVLVSAATRGDGRIGEDVTHTIRTIRGVPETLTREVDLIVEGEVYMERSGFLLLNEERKQQGLPVFSNPRNAAAGSIRQLDPKVTLERPLGVYLYDIDDLGDKVPNSQLEELEYIKKVGLPTNPHSNKAESAEDIFLYWKYWNGKKRDAEDYQIDGVVIKVNEIEYQKVLGYTGKSPRFALAFKFPAEQVTTTVQDITLQVGRTGVLTPLAHLTPVSVGGSIVARATLHNQDFITAKDIRIGDTVILQKAGDIIPEIVQVLPEFRTGKEKKWIFPETSTLCGGDGRVERVSGQVAFRCASGGSFAERLRALAHFAGKHALDIDGLGEKTVELLMEHQLVGEAVDFFDLSKDELVNLPSFKEKSADNLLTGIEKSRKVKLSKLLIGLSILHVGAETARLLAEHFGTLQKLIEAKREELEKISGIGSVVANSLTLWFSDSGNRELLKRLEKHLVIISEKKKDGGKLKGLTFVITGTLRTLKRKEAEELIRLHGGDVVSSVSKNTSFLLTGEKAGTKKDTAESFGVHIISESEFKAKIGS